MMRRNINTIKLLQVACYLFLFAVCALPLSSNSEDLIPNLRSIPINTFWGKAQITSADGVTIAGHRFLFAPAVFIRNERNTLITPHAMLALPQNQWVRFNINSQNQVDRIWILNPFEVRQIAQ